MSHEICYAEYKYGASKSKIIADIEEEVMHEDWREGGHYHGNLTWHENTIYDSRNEALKAILAYDRGWYDDHAVLYNSYPFIQDSKKIAGLFVKIDKLKVQRSAYREKHAIANRKSELITCTNCKSKVARSYFNADDRCPVCNASLRSEAVQKKLDWYDEQITDAFTAITEERDRISKKHKPQVMWLVKYEYHT